MVQVPLVAQQQGREIGWQLQLSQFVQQVVCVVEAIPVADAVHDDEGLAPPDVVVQTSRGL